jgi:hypothetical protein
MTERFFPDAAEFKRNVAVLCSTVDAAAARAGVPDGAGGDLESTLAALPPFARDRVNVLLQGIRMQSSDDNPAMALAASYVLALAKEVWDTSPPAPAETAAASNQIHTT